MNLHCMNKEMRCTWRAVVAVDLYIDETNPRDYTGVKTGINTLTDCNPLEPLAPDRPFAPRTTRRSAACARTRPAPTWLGFKGVRVRDMGRAIVQRVGVCIGLRPGGCTTGTAFRARYGTTEEGCTRAP